MNSIKLLQFSLHVQRDVQAYVASWAYTSSPQETATPDQRSLSTYPHTNTQPLPTKELKLTHPTTEKHQQ